MAAFGTKPTCGHVRLMVANGGKADISLIGQNRR
jgi:hypothetical protein